MFSILKMKDELVLMQILHKKTIWWCHFASNEPEAYLEPRTHLSWNFFASTVNGYKSLPILAKMLHHRCSTGFWICLCKLHSTSFNIRSYTIMTFTKMTNFLTNCPANPIRKKQQKICFLKILESVNMWQFQRRPRAVHLHVINVWSLIGTNFKKRKWVERWALHMLNLLFLSVTHFSDLFDKLKYSW